MFFILIKDRTTCSSSFNFQSRWETEIVIFIQNSTSNLNGATAATFRDNYGQIKGSRKSMSKGGKRNETARVSQLPPRPGKRKWGWSQRKHFKGGAGAEWTLHKKWRCNGKGKKWAFRLGWKIHTAKGVEKKTRMECMLGGEDLSAETTCWMLKQHMSEIRWKRNKEL